MMSRPRSTLACAAATLFLATFVNGCSDSSRIVRPRGGQALHEIVDGTHGVGGNSHFYFLQPLVTPPATFSGVFDGTQSPTVEVCEFTGIACTGGLIAEFTMNSGYGSEHIRVDPAGEQYTVNWHTDRVNLDPAKVYRVRVLVRSQELGHADVVAVNSGAALRNVDADNLIGFVDGRTLAIKFRLEVGAVVSSAPMGAYFNHTCGIASDGTAFCWGFDFNGELGNGPANCCGPGFGFYQNPQLVSTNVRFATITVGAAATCALAITGRVYCWGSNEFGTIGNPAATLVQAVPVEVDGNHIFTQLTSGPYHVCALAQDGTAYCWGENTSGQIGNGTSGGIAASPTAVPGYRFLSLSAGGAQTCGVTTGGAAYCWGNNYNGQLGNGYAFEQGTGQLMYPTPQQVSTATRFASTKIGERISCALTSSGATWCWGLNAELFLTGTSDQPLPAAVPAVPAFANLAVGRFFMCGRTAGGDVYCWGDNRDLEIGPTIPPNTDVVPNPTWIPGFSFASIAAGQTYVCGVLLDRTGVCWGGDLALGLANGTPGGPTPSPIAGGIQFATQ